MNRQELEIKYRATTPETFPDFMAEVKRAKEGAMSAFEVQSLLCRLADEQKSICRSRADSCREPDEAARKHMTMAAKLEACAMIAIAQTHSKNAMRAHALQFLEYAAYTCSSGYDIVQLALKCLSFTLIDPGFTWQMIDRAFSTDMLVYQMIKEGRFDHSDAFPDISISSAGAISIAEGSASVSSVPPWEANDESFKASGISIYTRNARAEKIKSSDVDSASALESFARTFSATQAETLRKGAVQEEQNLIIGNEYAIRLQTETTEDGTPFLSCRPLGTRCDEICEVEEEELIKGIYTSDIIPYLYDDDCIAGAVLVDKNAPPLFSIKDAYSAYAKRAAEKDYRQNRCFEAQVCRIFHSGESPEKDRVILVSDKGYGGMMRYKGRYGSGDKVIVSVVSVMNANGGLFINLDEASAGIPARFSPEEALADFALEESSVKGMACETNGGNAEDGTAELIRSLARILSRSGCGTSMDRYRSRLAASFMATIVEDKALKGWASSSAAYLCQCLKFAEGTDVNASPDAPALTDEEKRIIRILALAGSADMLRNTVASLYEESACATERQIARVMIVGSLSVSMPEFIKADADDIRMKIASILGVQDHFRAGGLATCGKYGFGELSNVEFKSSYVYSNRTGLPDIDYQGRGQVFEAVCGFLNKDGGTVYIGVNNFGNPIISGDYGLAADLKWFNDNFAAISEKRKRQLGHPVPMPKELDSMCNFLNCEKSLFFKPSLQQYITISPTEDYDAIRIDVRPSEFEIARLYGDETRPEGVAYIRNGTSTVPMSRRDQEQRLMKLRSVGKVEQFILTLTEAIDKQHKVTLKRYHSGNSNKIDDRFVVPINLVYNDENLWAYDLEAGECKEFRLERIEAIETDPEDARYPHSFRKGESDIFRWIVPDVNYHIKLRLSIRALNNLREEYSLVKTLPESELHQESPDVWILDTVVHGLGAVRRFYMGLADQIEILDTEDSETLKSEIRRFKEKIV